MSLKPSNDPRHQVSAQESSRLPKSPVNEIVVQIDERLSQVFMDGVRKLLEGAKKDASLATSPIDHLADLPNGSLQLSVHDTSADHDRFLKYVLATHQSQYSEDHIRVILSGPIDRVVLLMTQLESPDVKGAAIEALARKCGLERLADAPELRKHTGPHYPEHHSLHSEVRQTLGEVWSRRLKTSGLV